jgi:deazaflavin-dependent oxidoreductase (nitroreductase family)
MPAGALRAMGKLNVPIYRLTRGRMMNKIGRAPVMLLTSIGRRSGRLRTAPVLYLADDERLIVVSSNGGNDRAPAWSYNLEANADAEVEIRGEHRQVRARVAEGEERAELWRKMNQHYAGFEDYDQTTSREIAVFVLEPR